MFYKYVVAERIEVLRNGFIRFTQPEALNDPWEMKPLIEQLVSEEDLQAEFLEPLRHKPIDEYKPLIYEAVWKDIQKMLPPEQARFLTPGLVNIMLDQLFREKGEELSQEMSSYIDLIGTAFRSVAPKILRDLESKLRKATGVLSLAEQPDNELMWAHYAGNHSGFVIAFDQNHPFFLPNDDDDEAGGLHQIKYTSERPRMEKLLGPSPDFIPLFFTKKAEWAYEREWRLVRLVNTADKVIENPAGAIYLFNLPPTCVTGVILGCRMLPAQKNEICAFLRTDKRYPHVAISEVETNEDGYGLRIKPVYQ